jgi:hypothetical protein
MSVSSVSQKINDALSDGVVTADELRAIAEEARKDGLDHDEKIIVRDFILNHYNSSNFEQARSVADSLFDEFYTPPPAGGGLNCMQVTLNGESCQAFKTTGGYTVVIEGNGAISVYGPGQVPGDGVKPLTRIWGDPHVNEGDGTNWDFTRDGDLVLPDGTTLVMDTSANTGASVLNGLTIVSGGQRVEITGLQNDRPEISAIRDDGEAWLEQHNLANPQRERYHLFGDSAENVEWWLEKDGKMQGRISGSRWENDAYEVNTDGLGGYDNKNMTLEKALELLNENFAMLDLADGRQDGAISLLALAKILNDPNASPELKQAARFFLNRRDDFDRIAGTDLRFSKSEVATAAESASSEAEIRFAREEMKNILQDPSLTVEDQVTFLLFLMMKTMDSQIERQGKHILELQLNGVESEAKKRAQGQATTQNNAPRGWGAAADQNGQANGWGAAANGNGASADTDAKAKLQSIDVEVVNLKRMIDKRSQVFDMLRQIVDKYNQTAKGIIDSIGR